MPVLPVSMYRINYMYVHVKCTGTMHLYTLHAKKLKHVLIYMYMYVYTCTFTYVCNTIIICQMKAYCTTSLCCSKNQLWGATGPL